MTRQTPYTAITREAFSNYLDNNNLETLTEQLRYIEQLIMADEDEEIGKKVWFRFFEGDSLKTTINDIEKELQTPGHPSYTILRQGIAFGLKTNELEVHYA